MQATTAAVAGSQSDSEVAHGLLALVTHLHKHCNADLLEAVGTLELTLTQIKLLHRLEDPGPDLSLKEAAEAIHVSLPGASRLVDDLVRRGLIERTEDAEDRRVKRLELTDAGRAAIQRLNIARLKGLAQFAATLSDRERERLSAAITTLLERPEIAACRQEGIDA